jgi:ketosteroid isomerase-like protein
MKAFVFTLLVLLLISSCQINQTNTYDRNRTSTDSLALLEMIQVREKVMQTKDIQTVVSQFREDATFINGGDYYVKNRSEIEKFQHRISQLQPGYTSAYQAGKVTIQILSPEFALAYYPWKIITIKTTSPTDTTIGTGLMTLLAQKDNKGWKWRAITNQRTGEYFEDLETHLWKP